MKFRRRMLALLLSGVLAAGMLTGLEVLEIMRLQTAMGQTAAAANLTDVVVVGFDGTFNAMDSISNGEMSASVAQLPVEEGYQGVINAVKILDGETVEKEQPLDVVVLNEENVAEFRTDLEARIEESGVKLGN